MVRIDYTLLICKETNSVILCPTAAVAALPIIGLKLSALFVQVKKYSRFPLSCSSCLTRKVNLLGRQDEKLMLS
jgi:hypothetical protein